MFKRTPELKKLQELHDYVDTLDDSLVYMNCWAKELPAPECDTVACLGGHATTLWPEALELYSPPYGVRDTVFIREKGTDGVEESGAGGNATLYTLCKFFGITVGVGDHLFHGGRDKTEALEELQTYITDQQD